MDSERRSQRGMDILAMKRVETADARDRNRETYMATLGGNGRERRDSLAQRQTERDSETQTHESKSEMDRHSGSSPERHRWGKRDRKVKAALRHAKQKTEEDKERAEEME